MKIRWGNKKGSGDLSNGGIMVMRKADSVWSDRAWRTIVNEMRNPLYQRDSFHTMYWRWLENSFMWGPSGWLIRVEQPHHHNSSLTVFLYHQGQSIKAQLEVSSDTILSPWSLLPLGLENWTITKFTVPVFYRNYGIGSVMLQKLDELACIFNVLTIQGQLGYPETSEQDLQRLSRFYKKHGYIVRNRVLIKVYDPPRKLPPH